MSNTDPWIRRTVIIVCVSAACVLAECPSADITSDCFVDLCDLVSMANQWLEGDSSIPSDMAHISSGGFAMGDHHGDVAPAELPVHPVL